VHLEADAVPEAVEEPVGERNAVLLRAGRLLARRLEDLARPVEDVLAARAVPDLGDRAVERLLAQSVPRGHVLRHVTDDERARHVAVDVRGVVARPDVDHDRHPRLDRAGAHVVPHRALRPRRDDEVVAARVVLREDDVHRRLHLLDRQPAVSDPRAQQLARDVHRRLGRALRTPHPGQLGLRLHAASLVEEVLVDRQLDPVRAQMVGEPERKRLRDDGVGDPDRLCAAQRELGADRRHPEARLAELVDPEVVHQVQLVEVQLGEADRLHRVGHDVLRPVLLGVQNRVGHAERHLVAQLRRAEGVGVDQGVGHAPDVI
jgi:hypothetical protein